MDILKAFQGEPWIGAGVFGFMAVSILIQVLLDLLYRSMIKETDNMATTNNRMLKQCKMKFENCYQLNRGVANVSVFVDKFLNRLALGCVSFETLYHLSGQSILLSVIFAGVGICKGILHGKSLGAILPLYVVSFLGIYLFFSVSSVVDIKNKRRILKINLIDYLENHLAARIGVTESDMEMLYGAESTKRRRTVELMPIGGRPEIASPDRAAVDHAAAAARLDSVRISDEELADLIKEFC